MQLQFERHTERVEAVLAEVKASGGWPEEEMNKLDDIILERVRGGQTTSEIVAALAGSRPKHTSRATLYRKVRAARQTLGMWEGGSRR